jgi:hypothetical protein
VTVPTRASWSRTLRGEMASKTSSAPS